MMMISESLLSLFALPTTELLLVGSIVFQGKNNTVRRRERSDNNNIIVFRRIVQQQQMLLLVLVLVLLTCYHCHDSASKDDDGVFMVQAFQLLPKPKPTIRSNNYCDYQQRQQHANNNILQSSSLLSSLSFNNNGIFSRRYYSTTSSSTTATTTQLHSLRQLIDEITTTASSGNTNTKTKNKKEPKTIFVGGKGGVGKTTVSSALAVCLASNGDANTNVLIVSTDPAHSLGDALDYDDAMRMQSRGGRVLCLTDPLTSGRLYTCEVDAVAALDEFRSNIAAFDVQKLATALGVPEDLLINLGLSEFSSLLNNPPPGLDELVALSNVLDRKDDGLGIEFDVIIVDTAPTGHTLRLLALPQFLDGLLGKLIKLRLKLSGIASTLQSFLGSNREQAQQRAKAIDDASSKLEQFRIKMTKLRTTLQNPDTTQFVVVTVPTKLGVAESKRLISELNNQRVTVSDIVINQCVVLDHHQPDNNNKNEQSHEDDGEEKIMNEGLVQYYDRRLAGQSKWIHNLQDAIDKVSGSEEYQKNGPSSGNIALTQVPFFDVELVGVPALGYVGAQIFINNPNFDHLLSLQSSSSSSAAVREKPPPKVVICGGKGGVGKTTTSAALAVSMAAAGHKVALISTDPAHSLGDAIDMNLQGGNLQDCPLIGVPNNTGEGSLSVLEIDPAKAISQFKGVVDQLVGGGGTGSGKDGLTDTLRDLQEVFDTLPAGTDEVVALARIVKLVKEGNYDRIVLDTAPTGHTLRMLSTPGFIADLIERLLRISDKVNSNAAVKMFLAASQRSEDIATAVETSKSTLLSFQFQMYDLEDMFSDAEQTEFLIVTIATELSVRESVRLLNDLTYEAPDMPIKVRNVVVNQVLSTDESDAKNFLSHLEHSQKASIEDLKRSALSLVPKNPPRITEVRYLDTEPCGVFGLKALAAELIREDEPAVAKTPT